MDISTTSWFLIFIVVITIISSNSWLNSGPYQCEQNALQDREDQDSVTLRQLIKKYMKKRADIIQYEDKLTIGANLTLTDKEEKVNKILLKLKRKITQDALKTSQFPFATNFIKARKSINENALYKMLKKMPKGGILHTHDFSMFNYDWLIQNATYRRHCYMCLMSGNSSVQFKFHHTRPSTADCPSWQLVSDVRAKSKNYTEFDIWLKSLLMLGSDYPDQNTVWREFERCLRSASGLILYKEVYVDYIYEALRSAQSDGVQYMEIRILAGFENPMVYDLYGHLLPYEGLIRLYSSRVDAFVAKYPSFVGAKVIATSMRTANQSVIKSSLKKMVALYKKYSDFVIGFDLVAQEDTGHPLLYYIKSLLTQSLSNKMRVPYFFHSGETDFFGTRVDDNLVDAVLLNTTRIGHGYALSKHPSLMKIVKEKQICIEVNPISNQVLGLVKDLRNHPMVALIAQNYPIIISSDDPAAWDGDPLTHDFYAAFVAMSSQTTGLRFLKQLAINSFKYSGMRANEKARALKIWNKLWVSYIEKMVQEFSPV